MAVCPQDALIATNPCLLELSDAALMAVIYGATQNWALSLNPTLDVGIPGSMQRAACLMELSGGGTASVFGGALGAIVSSLLCNIASTSSSNACADSDANAFILAAGITDPTQITAVCTLVGSLKSAGIWTAMDAIYPFVGGSSSSNSVNLKSPGTHNVTWHGNVSFSNAGPSPLDATGYGDTGFNPTTAVSPQYLLVSGSVGAYMVGAGCGIGLEDSGFTSISLVENGSSNSVSGLINTGGGNTISGTSSGANGMVIVSRITAASSTLYFPGGSVFNAGADSSLVNGSFAVCAVNQVGGSVFNQSSPRFAFIGSGLTSTQAANYSTIVTTFQTTLGRN